MMSIRWKRSILHDVMQIRLWFLIFVFMFVVSTTGCVSFQRGAYQVDIFTEMHYTQAYRSQEPPRLYPPSGAVPFQADGTDKPVWQYSEGELVLVKTSDTVEQGKALFGVNCAVCHGASGLGDGAMENFLIKWGGILPPDLTGDIPSGRSDGDLVELINSGGSTKLTFAKLGINPPSEVSDPISMPEFDKLLAQDEVQMLVHYLRDIQGQ